MRINDEITTKLKIVDSVATYIDNLNILKNEWCDDNWFMVYRGEPEEYKTPCIPNIYRGFALKQTPNYEINMFMAMRQSEITKSDDYLHNAIDAQHDGFPSRLLDVTYNSLIALYFAVTPYYYRDESDLDDKDGMVYVFKYDEAYSPEAKNTKEIYVNALRGSGDILNSPFLAYHHILIDHCKQNKRIVAQQGAFILFRGEKPTPIPHYLMCGIRVSKNAKTKIRNELKVMFGIYTGSVYPEVELMHEEVKARCLRFNTNNEDINSAIKYALDDLKEEFDYYADCCEYYIDEEKPTGELMRIIEKDIVSHEKHIKVFLSRLSKYYKESEAVKSEKSDAISMLTNGYNNIMKNFRLNIPTELQDSFGSKKCGND